MDRKNQIAEKQNKFIHVQADIYNLIINSQLVSKSKVPIPFDDIFQPIDSRGRAVHLLNQGAVTKKRKNPDSKRALNELALSL